MDISSVKKGDVVGCEMRGWKFLAVVEDVVKSRGQQTKLMITPDQKNCTHRHCYATDVKAHYKKMGRKRASRKLDNGETLQAV